MVLMDMHVKMEGYQALIKMDFANAIANLQVIVASSVRLSVLLMNKLVIPSITGIPYHNLNTFKKLLITAKIGQMILDFLKILSLKAFQLIRTPENSTLSKLLLESLKGLLLENLVLISMNVLIKLKLIMIMLLTI